MRTTVVGLLAASLASCTASRGELGIRCRGGAQASCDELSAQLAAAPVKVLEAECSARDQESCTELGRRVVWGIGLPPDRVRGRTMLTGACDLGTAYACDLLKQLEAPTPAQLADACNDLTAKRCTDALAALRGLSVPELEAACAQRDPYRCTELARRSAFGLDVAEDRARSRALLTEACAAGAATACELQRRLDALEATERLEPPTTGEGLEREVIKQIITLHSDELQHCYERELQRGNHVDGDVSASWRIDLEGSVSDVQLTKNTFPTKQVGDCITARIGRWRFPRPTRVVVDVSFPWVFQQAR